MTLVFAYVTCEAGCTGSTNRRVSGLCPEAFIGTGLPKNHNLFQQTSQHKGSTRPQVLAVTKPFAEFIPAHGADLLAMLCDTKDIPVEFEQQPQHRLHTSLCPLRLLDVHVFTFALAQLQAIE